MNIKNKVIAIACLSMVSLAACNQVDSTSKNESASKTETAGNTEPSKENSSETQTILFFGNSLTAGYGLEPDQAFPALIQQRIDSLNLPYKVVNAGVSGETTAGGKSRIDWLLKQPVGVFILELGANDGLRGIDLSESYENLKSIIEKVRAKNPDVKIVLAGMQIPPSMGQKYTSEFKEMYTRIAQEENVLLIPFLLEGVAGDPELNQADGIHPTVEGQKILADNVWEILQSVLKAEESA